MSFRTTYNNSSLAVFASVAYRELHASCGARNHRLAKFLHCKPLSNGLDTMRVNICHVHCLDLILKQLSDEYNSLPPPLELEPFLIMKYRLLWTFSCQCGRLRRTFLFHC